MDDILKKVQSLYAAFAIGDIPTVIGALAADIRWTEAEGGPYKATGKSFKAPFAHVWKFQGGKAVSFQQYTDTAVHSRPLQA